MKTTAYGYVKNGKLELLNRRRFADDMRQFRDCDVEIIIKKKGKRSNQQNRYYHGVLVPEITARLRQLGNDVNAEVVHEYLKGRFNAKRGVDANGEVMDLPGTTTELNKSEFVEYTEAIIRWAAESLDLVIPPPNTQTSFFLASYDNENNVTLIQ